jgi:hypothetical protein
MLSLHTSISNYKAEFRLNPTLPLLTKKVNPQTLKRWILSYATDSDLTEQPPTFSWWVCL